MELALADNEEVHNSTRNMVFYQRIISTIQKNGVGEIIIVFGENHTDANITESLAKLLVEEGWIKGQNDLFAMIIRSSTPSGDYLCR